MTVLSGISLIEIMDLIGTIATVVALIFAIKSFDKNTRINEAIFVKELYKDFQRDRQAILDNPQALKVLADERKVSPKKIIKESIGSFDVNRAYIIYHLHERKLTPKKQWERDIRDMKVLFSDELVLEKWEKVSTRYPEDFQQFVNDLILQKVENH